MFDLTQTRYRAVSGGAFALDLGVFDGFGGENTTEDDTGLDYAAADHTDEILHTDEADTISTDTLRSPSAMGGGLNNVFGGAGPDNIFLGDGDEATGGERADTFSVYEIESPDAPPARITDFDATEDSLHIQYYARENPDTGEPIDPDLTVTYDTDTDRTAVSIFGAEIATLAGDAGIAASDVMLIEIA